MVRAVVISLRSAAPTDLDLLRHWNEQPHAIASENDLAPKLSNIDGWVTMTASFIA